MTQVVHSLPGCLKKNWGHKLRVYPLLQAPQHHCNPVINQVVCNMAPIIRQFSSSGVNYVYVCDLPIAEEDEEEETAPPQPEVETEKEKPAEKQDEEGKVLNTPHIQCPTDSSVIHQCYFSIIDVLS